MRRLIVATALGFGAATAGLAAPPAETNVRAALERIARIDPQLHSVIEARGRFPTPKFYRSIEESPEIAPLLLPQR